MGAIAALVNLLGGVLLAHAYVTPTNPLPIHSPKLTFPRKQRLQRLRTLPPPDLLPTHQTLHPPPAIPRPENQPPDRHHARNTAVRLPPLHRHRAQQSRTEAHPMERLGGERGTQPRGAPDEAGGRRRRESVCGARGPAGVRGYQGGEEGVWGVGEGRG